MNVKQAAGGLALQQREEIAIISQEMYASADSVEVDYIFLNRSRRDITTTVLFSLPLWPFVPASGVFFPAGGGEADDGDNSAGFEILVEGEKIQISFQTERVNAFSGGYGGDTGRTTYYWEQIFPVGEPVHIHHRYTPVIGTGAFLPLTEILKMTDSTYCPDAAFRASVYYRATREKYDSADYDNISYLLQGGKNWAGVWFVISVWSLTGVIPMPL